MTRAEENFPHFLKIQWTSSVFVSLAVPGKLTLTASLSLFRSSAPLVSSTLIALVFRPTSQIPSAWILPGLLRSPLYFGQPTDWASTLCLIPGPGDALKKEIPLQHSCLGNPMDGGAWWAIQPMWLQRVRHNLATKQQCA